MLVFLKLGGSLITNKRQAETPRLDVITRLAQEIAAARQQNPNLRLVIGNGAGSFGHVPAKKYRTRDGVATPDEWFGYTETADAAARLNRLIVNALLKANVPAWTLQPSAMVSCADGKIVSGSAQPIAQALRNGLVPVVHGDVALDSVRGGTIISTEEIFEWLALALPDCIANAEQPEKWRLRRIVLAGEVDGIFSSDPLLDPNAKLISTITPETFASIKDGLGSSHGVDVTGGMLAKVQQAFEMTRQTEGLDIIVCSGLIEENVFHTLKDEYPSDVGASEEKHHVGTRIFELIAQQ